MEKRTFLAIIISILILFSYQRMFVSKRPASTPLSDPQIVVNTVDKIDSVDESKQIERTKRTEKKESFFVFETASLLFHFSDLGGSLKTVTIKEHDETLPVENFFSLADYNDRFFDIEVIDNKIIYSLVDNGVVFRKIYDLSRQDYQFDFELNIKNVSEMSKVKSVALSPFVINSDLFDDLASASREKNLLEYSYLFDGQIKRKGNAFKFSQKEDLDKSGQLKRFAFRNRYFCSIVNFEFETQRFIIESLGEDKLKPVAKMKSLVIERDTNQSFYASVYYGPQNIHDMKEYGKNFEDVVVFSQFGFLDFISKLIVNTMNLLHRFVPNWGLVIVLVSFLVYGAMYPLTVKGMMSMKKMQVLQPEITKIRESNKNNPKKMNQEVLELYKENAVNPFSGCLPFIFQMPVFIGLYQALWRYPMFKGADFLWIKDLSEPDRFILLNFNLPLIGNEINLLPLLMIVIMFFQQKFSSRNMVVTDPNQAMQQKMMLFFMPLMMGFIFYKFASGLTLYFTVFYILSTLAQWKMSKKKMVSK
jgi:YidC/Oxa1 family membrane protein insertase